MPSPTAAFQGGRAADLPGCMASCPRGPRQNVIRRMLSERARNPRTAPLGCRFGADGPRLQTDNHCRDGNFRRDVWSYRAATTRLHFLVDRSRGGSSRPAFGAIRARKPPLHDPGVWRASRKRRLIRPAAPGFQRAEQPPGQQHAAAAPTHGLSERPAPRAKPAAKAAEAGDQQTAGPAPDVDQVGGPHCCVARGPSLSANGPTNPPARTPRLCNQAS